MTPRLLVNFIRDNCSEELARSITGGASWELIAENIICQAIFKVTKKLPTRQFPYPGSTKTADFAFTDDTVLHVVELKVESAHEVGKFAGNSFAADKSADKAKLETFNATVLNQPTSADVPQHVPFTVVKIQVFIGYSGPGKASIGTMTNWTDSGDGLIRYGANLVE